MRFKITFQPETGEINLPYSREIGFEEDKIETLANLGEIV